MPMRPCSSLSEEEDMRREHAGPPENVIEKLIEVHENNGTLEKVLDSGIGEVVEEQLVNIVDLNSKDGDFNGGLGYTATDDPEIFVYDFNTADSTSDRFFIQNFDPTQDTLIFANAEVPGDGIQVFPETESAVVYADVETQDLSARPYPQTFVEAISPGSSFDYSIFVQPESGASGADLIHVGGTEDPNPLFGLIYNDDEIYPEPTPSPFGDPYDAALVYEGDPLAVEGIR